MTGEKKKAIFLDRDGTLNVDRGYVYKPEDWEWADAKVPQTLRRLKDAGYLLIVVTNQSGIAQGLYTIDDMHALHEHMERELQADGVQLDLIMFCPHPRNGHCQCRKPGTGMLEDADRKLDGINMAASWLIGDKLADVKAGQRAGTKTGLIKSKYWDKNDVLSMDQPPDLVVDTLDEAANIIVGN